MHLALSLKNTKTACVRFMQLPRPTCPDVDGW